MNSLSSVRLPTGSPSTSTTRVPLRNQRSVPDTALRRMRSTSDIGVDAASQC
jgi:hypothetical protein